MDSPELHHNLEQFIGGDQLYFHPNNPDVQYTEGFRFFIRNAGTGVGWLLSMLITEKDVLEAHEKHGFLLVTLKVLTPDRRGVSEAHLSVRPDTDKSPVLEAIIQNTDCPQGEWKFYFENSVICLPQER